MEKVKGVLSNHNVIRVGGHHRHLVRTQAGGNVPAIRVQRFLGSGGGAGPESLGIDTAHLFARYGPGLSSGTGILGSALVGDKKQKAAWFRLRT